MHRVWSSSPRARGGTRFRGALIGLVVILALEAGASRDTPSSSATVKGADASPRAAPGPTPVVEGSADMAPAPEAAASSPADGPAPVEISLKTHDGHAFGGLYAAPASSGSNALLIVPDLGQRRDHFLRLVKALRARGYRVLSMDNTGQLRQIGRGPNAMPTFTSMTTRILGVLKEDVASGIAGLRTQQGVGRVALVGFGIGANAALLAGGADATVAAVGAVVPNYGCEDFDPYAAFGDMNSRPVLLLESRKKYTSDLSSAFERIMAKRKDLPFEHVKLRRDPEALTQEDLEEDYEESLMAWLEKAFPSTSN